MGSGMGSQASMLLTDAASGSSVVDWTDGTRHVAVTEAVRRPDVATVQATPASTSALTCALGFPL